MTAVDKDISVTAQVRNSKSALKVEVIATVQSNIAVPMSLTDVEIECIDMFTDYAIERVLTALDATGRESAVPDAVPALPRRLSQDAVRDICQLAVARTWQKIVAAAAERDLAQLLRTAERIFHSGQNLLLGALNAHTDRVVAQENDGNLRKAIAQALVCGEPAEELAALAKIKLADSYLVLVLDRPGDRSGVQQAPDMLDHDLRLEYRRDILSVTYGDHRIALVPSVGLQRVELRALSERALRGVASAAASRAAAAPAHGREHIGDAITEARVVLQVVRTLQYPPGIYQLDDVPIEAALVRSPDLANLLSMRLAPLYGSGAPLLETLRVYLDSSQDRRQAARVLHIHPNTLDYRLRRIRELTGLSPTVPRDIQTLGGALIAWHLVVGMGKG